ncbi:50S ribosomal protein L11 methyltransferase [Lichenicoccus roseus]|uniref:Ribosomal protein L11 methyltransferase n=1 Tax=Lichenicoccus roseus TaxID=2683649 RepID=A0A5R9JAJ7_9PROT|nr:50S ribosomal protein L11 methyltransferase [Lichenicoccus roseus]TLU72396.1 methyltransferase domain-containing protein [Lichenicoccus roseus]
MSAQHLGSRRRHALRLETVHVTVPEAAVEAYEAALASVCGTVGIFEADDTQTVWRIEGVKDEGADEPALATALALAHAATGIAAALYREPTEAEGWLSRTYSSFPEQHVGRRFAVRGTHLGPAPRGERLTLVLDAGIAFGSGEHGSTRGCLRALEIVAHRRPARILDLGAGSGILAMAAAALLHRPVLAVDIEPWSVRVAAQNAAMNRLHRLVACRLGNGWRTPAIRAGAPYDLVFANILARPLCRMALSLATSLAPGGTAILAGLLGTQVRMVLAAHRRQGLVLERVLREGDWATLILRRRARIPGHAA